MIKNNFPHPIIFGIIGIILFVISLFIIISNLNKNNPEISIVGDDIVQVVTIKYLDNGLRLRESGESAAKEYLRTSGIVSESYLENSEIVRVVNDEEEKSTEYDIQVPYSHYFFQQYIGGIPVQDAIMGVHMRNNNEVYYVYGSVISSEHVEERNISIEEAVGIAVMEARKEIGSDAELNSPVAEEVIYNGRLIGFVNDNRNFSAVKVTVSTNNDIHPFANEYFVSLLDGELLEKRTLIFHALNRYLLDCRGTAGSCSVARTEGGPVYGDADVDGGYEYFGDTYNFLYENYQRDSFDNQGAQLRGFMNYYFSRPNAAWDGREKRMIYSPGMAVPDITGHELMHAVTSSTAGLIYNAQSGAINEGMSDVFGWAVDQKDWTMGEDSVLGAIRSLSNPPLRGQPDRLFAPNYWCNSADNYGVHKNSGILNKTFYLLVEGGSFNTCNISSIGKDRALAIFYRSLTRYLTPSSNFRNLYDSLLQSCNDLYGSEQGVCEQVDIASQATQIDQQPVGTQAGPFCSNNPGQAPKCSAGTGGGGMPIATPTPVGPTSPGGGFTISGRVFQDNNGDGVYNSGDIGLSNETVILSGDFSDTTSTLTDGIFVFDNLFAGTFNVAYGSISSNGISLTQTVPEVFINFILTRDPVNPTPTIVVGPTSIPQPATPTPVPVISTPTRIPTVPPTYYSCDFDPNCASEQSNIQLCPLICTEL